MVPNRANCFIFAFSEPENFTKNKNIQSLGTGIIPGVPWKNKE